MATLEREHSLWVVEGNGGPRGGKGTLTSAMANSFPGAAEDETGADYRAATRGLIDDEILDPEMDKLTVARTIEGVEQEQIATYAAQRHEIVAERGLDVLYSEDIAGIVGFVSPSDKVRAAVKEGFSRRVQRHVENPDTHFLFVDGRNLTPVIKKIEGADILLRLFVNCQPFAAALREAAREGIDVSDPDNEAWFRKTVSDIRNRQVADETREIDAVKREASSINYWFDMGLHYETAERYAKELKIPFAEAARMLVGGEGRYRKGGRHGAGAKAFAEGRQVYFDTTEIGKEAMIGNARRMVEEALQQSSGSYIPSSPLLFEAA